MSLPAYSTDTSSTLPIAPPAARSAWPPRWAASALPAAAALWMGVALAGQVFFAAYVAIFYGSAAAAGELERWRQVLPRGWVPGQTLDNAMLSLHLLFAVLIIVSGALQMLPVLRRRAPAVHRWNGRFYLLGAVLLGAGGLVMVATRSPVGDTAQHLGVSLNALLILAFAGLAWREALARRFDRHRRWALRLWMVVGGVWFFRIGLMGWIVVNQGPVGFDPRSFTGPFLIFLSFAQTLLPLSVLELYLRVRANGGPKARLAMAAGLGALTLLTALGIAAAAALMWLPRM